MNEFLLGGLSGVGQVIIGYPFDTIKVLHQNSKSITSLKPSQYFRGITYPIISSCFSNSIVFGVYYNSKQYTNNNFLSGLISGLSISPIVYFFDIYKIKRQMNMKISSNDFFTSKGLTACLLREMFAFGIYFSSYDYLHKEYNVNSFISGGIAGVLNWSFTYPLDVIRTRQIVNNCNFFQAYKIDNIWKGYNICILRALLVNSCGFYIYEICKELHI
jgi:solute carrier family 25 carnitine/acylcarnitine transporter 20/29